MIWKRKKLLVLFSCFVSLLLAGFSTSLTAHAYDITSTVKYKQTIFWGNQNYPPTFYFKTPNGNQTKSGMGVYAPLNGVGQYSIYYIRSGYRTTIKAGNIYSFNITFNFSIAQTAQVSPVDYLSYSGNSYFRLLGIQKTAGREFCAQWQESQVQTSPTSAESLQGILYNFRTVGSCTQSSDTYELILQAQQDVDNLALEVGNYNQDPLFNWTLSQVPFQSLETQYGTISISPLSEWELDSPSAINQQQQEAGEQAQQDGNTAGSNSQSEAQQGGSTLMQGFSDFVGALTSSSASDCVLNGDIGDFKMGNMDLCQISPPPAFQAISSIMVIGFVVPLSIATIRKFIGMFRSFQNG